MGFTFKVAALTRRVTKPTLLRLFVSGSPSRSGRPGYNGAMLRTRTYARLLLVAAFSLPLAALADLPAKFAEELALDPDQVPIAATVQASVGMTPVVMIAGILNETAPDYFLDSVDSLSKDFSQTNVLRLFPSSFKTIEDNAKIVAEQVRKAWEDFGKKPILVIAHSKGAAEILLATLHDPSLIRDGIIDRLVLIQPALGGSYIADMLLDDEAGDWPAAKPFNWLFKHWGGLWSLTTAQDRMRFSDALAATSDADRALISPRVFYVRAFQDAKKVSPELQLMHLFVQAHYGDNDGVLMPGDEVLPNFGNDLGIVDSDHFGLTVHGANVAAPDSYRRAFTRALLRELSE
jgi:hypothetical protein